MATNQRSTSIFRQLLIILVSSTPTSHTARMRWKHGVYQTLSFGRSNTNRYFCHDRLHDIYIYVSNEYMYTPYTVSMLNKCAVCWYIDPSTYTSDCCRLNGFCARCKFASTCPMSIRDPQSLATNALRFRNYCQQFIHPHLFDCADERHFVIVLVARPITMVVSSIHIHLGGFYFILYFSGL